MLSFERISRPVLVHWFVPIQWACSTTTFFIFIMVDHFKTSAFCIKQKSIPRLLRKLNWPIFKVSFSLLYLLKCRSPTYISLCWASSGFSWFLAMQTSPTGLFSCHLSQQWPPGQGTSCWICSDKAGGADAGSRQEWWSPTGSVSSSFLRLLMQYIPPLLKDVLSYGFWPGIFLFFSILKANSFI